MDRLTPRAVALPAEAVGAVTRLVQVGFDRAAEMQELAGRLQPLHEERIDPLARAAHDAEPRTDLTPADRNSDAVVLWAPGQRRLARRWLRQIADLSPTSRLVIVGERDNGIETLLRDAGELFGVRPAVRHGGGLRLAVFTRPTAVSPLPGWADEPGIRPTSFLPLRVTLGTAPYQLKTLPGVFSADGLDAGSALLLEALEDVTLPNGPILDLACGAGILGLAAALRGGNVTFSDINALACQVTRANLADLGLQGEVYCADSWQALSGRTFALIISNPPFHHVGRKVDVAVTGSILEGLAGHLSADGAAVIVANSFLAYRPFLERSFQRVTVLRATPSYTVWYMAEPREAV